MGKMVNGLKRREKQNELSAKLKKLRNSRKISMSEVAAGVGVPLSTYRDWEYGRSVPSEYILPLANYHQVSTGFLLGEHTSGVSLEDRLKRIVSDAQSALEEINQGRLNRE